MNLPKELKYSRSHEWVRMEGDEAVIGITDHAQNELGDLVFINLPNVDDEAVMGEAVADVESVKAVSDIISPLTGLVSAVNEDLMDQPELINQDPYGAWMVRIKDITASEELMDAAAYQAFVESEG